MRSFPRKPTAGAAIVLVLLLISALLRPRGSGERPPSAAGPAPQPACRMQEPATGWVELVLNSEPEKAVQLARARGERMRELIRSHPEQAVAEALPLAEWSALPPEIRAEVEQPFSALADVEVEIACGADTSETYVQMKLPDLGTLETHVFGRRAETDSKMGIPVQGIRVGGVATLREEIFQPLEAADEPAARALWPVAVERQGAESVAALAGGRIFCFKDRVALDEANDRLAKLEALPGPETGTQALFESPEAYILQDGAINFQPLETAAAAAAAAWTGTPRDMVVIMVDFSDNAGQPTDPAAFSNSLNTTVSQQISEMSYGRTYISATVLPATYRMPLLSSSYTNNVALLYTDAVDLAEADGHDLSSYETICVLFPHVAGFSWAGLASVGGIRLRLNGNTSPDVVIHELGHNYGLSHASSWEVGGINPVDPAGSRLEYGDFLDIMGSGDTPEGHFNVWHKQHIGWLDAENWKAVSSSGTFRIYRFDDPQTTALLRGLEIGKGGGDQYWVGLRQRYPGYERYARGAYLVWKKSGDNRSYLIDTRPQSADGVYDGGLALGQTYSDAAAGVHITPVARGGQTPNEWMDITVNLGSFPGNTAPTASLSGPSSLGVSESALFSVTASDADGDDLAYCWDIGDGLVKPNSPSIAAAWLSGGTATVSCTVSDMKGGTNRVSQTVIVSSPLENWTTRNSGTSAQLNDITVGNGRLVVVGRDWQTLYSDDGINWTVHTFAYPYSPYLHGVVFDGAKFVAVGFDYDFSASAWKGCVFTSANGAAWSRRYLNGSYLNDVAYGGGIYVAVGDGGAIVRSSDGISWSPVASGTAIDLSGVSYGDGTFVAVGSAAGGGPATVLTSSNGLSWVDHSAGVDLDSWKGLADVQYCNDRFLAGGWHARILRSLDQGHTFTTSMTGNGLVIPAFAYGGGTYFAAGVEKVYSGSWMSYDINLTSLDGENWTALATPAQDDRNAAVYFNGTFITVGDNGSIRQSGPLASGGGFAVWQLGHQAALGLNRDPLEDADFDGVDNLAEYALGTSASDAGSVPVYTMSADSGGYLTLSYGRSGVQSDVAYTVQRGVNLASNDWNTAGTVVVEDSATNLTVRSAYPITAQTNEFLRLKLELQQN